MRSAIRAFGSTLALLWVAHVVPAAATDSIGAVSATREWRFDVFLEEKPIGRQVFRVSSDGEHERMVTEASFDVKILFFTAYSYRHRNEETWRDGCLERIASTTDDNGQPFRVSGELRDAEFVVETVTNADRLPACVRTFAYWNPDHLRAPKLLNSQTGEYEDVTLELVGDETIEANGIQRAARRYALTSPKFRIDLWYSPDDRWLGLESSSRGGRRLRYVLQNH